MLGRVIYIYAILFKIFISFLYVHCVIQLDFFSLFCSIISAVKTSGGLRERLFNAAYNAKRQAIMHGKVHSQ